MITISIAVHDPEPVNPLPDADTELRRLGGAPVTGMLIEEGVIHMTLGNEVTYVIPMSLEMADRIANSPMKSIRL